MFGHVLLAMVLGGLLGFERELRHKPAGIRTNMLVCGAVCLFVLMGQELGAQWIERFGDRVSLSPEKIVEAVMVGVAFVGGGVIVQAKGKETVKNITTATVIMFTGAIGMAVALKLYWEAVGLIAVVWVVNRGVRWIEEKWLGTKDDD